ncbi:MAG TPA: hypothetical protein VHO02_06405, partial [Fibrobacteria bacterium]|nr:hypothetical protein [Fibrobacteria bacterium]
YTPTLSAKITVSSISSGTFAPLFGFDVSLACPTAKKSASAGGGGADTLAVRLRFKAKSGEFDTLMVMGHYCVSSIFWLSGNIQAQNPGLLDRDALGRDALPAKNFPAILRRP